MKKFGVLLGAGILVLTLTGCGTKPSETTIKEAEILYDMGKNQEALTQYNDMIAKNNNDVAALILRGKIFVKLGRYEDAINDFYKASKLDKSQETYLLYKGLVTMQTAVDVNALNILNDTGIALHKEMFAFYKCGLLYQLNSKETEACLDTLLAIDNNSPQANYLKAMILIKRGRYNESVKFFDKAEEGGLQSAELYSNHALALARSELSGYVETADKALALDSQSSGAYYAKALGYANNGTLKPGLTAIDNAIKIDADNKDYYFLKGDLLSRNGNYAEAVQNYDKAFSLDEKNSDILARKAIALHRNGDTQIVNDILNQAMMIIPNNIHSYSNLATALIIAKKYMDANIYLDKALALNSGHTYAIFQKGLDYYLLGNIIEANKRYGKLRNDYNPSEAKVIYANFLLSQANFIGAANTIEEILSKDPTNEYALATKVMIFDAMAKAGKTIPDLDFDYKTPSVLDNAKSKINRYWFLKNYR